MQTYNITITPENPDEEPVMFQADHEDIAVLTRIIASAVHFSDEFEFTTEDGEYVVITQNSEHGYNADLYASREAYENDEDAIGGGLCTGTLRDAVEMAITCR